MNKKLALLLTAAILPLLGATAQAGESKPLFNNRGQVIGTERTYAPKAKPAPTTKLIFNNRHQVIAVVETASR